MSVTLDMFDATPAKDGEPHGPKGPTHTMTTTADYEYQIEMYVDDAEQNFPSVVRIHSPELNREWVRGEDGKMHEQKPTGGFGNKPS